MPISGVEALKVRLRVTGYRAAHLRPVLLGAVANNVREMFRRIFETHGASIGEKWTPLAPSTVYRKLLLGQGFNHPLRATDRLFRSLTEPRAPDSSVQMEGE